MREMVYRPALKAVTLDGTNPPAIVEPLIARHGEATSYRPAEGVEAAIDVALWLGQPLLLTGEPGIGKTRLAYWLTQALNLDPEPLKCFVKSTTTATDLFYHFDEMARFRDSQPGRTPKPLIAYLRFNGLGKAILRAGGPSAPLLSLQGRPLTRGRDDALLREAFGDAAESGEPCFAHLLPDDPDFATAKPGHTVVLIDELDKAPRDTPNDLLNEIEQKAFEIRELGIRVALPAAAETPAPTSPAPAVRGGTPRPIIIITSNSEKNLPEPFLRRCVYFDIKWPSTDERLHEIVEAHIATLKGGPMLVRRALELMALWRDPQRRMTRPPGLAELLALLTVLVHRHRLSPDTDLGQERHRQQIIECLGSVLKNRDDQALAAQIVRGWTPR